MKKAKFLMTAILVSSIGAYAQVGQVQQQTNSGTTTPDPAATQTNGGTPATAPDPAKVQIRDLVEKVKTAPPDKKYIYMNQLKEKMMEMNRKEREKFMHEIVEELRENHHEKEHSKEYEHEHEHEYKNSEHYDDMMEKSHEVEEHTNEMQEYMMEKSNEIEDKSTETQERSSLNEGYEYEMEHDRD